MIQAKAFLLKLWLDFKWVFVLISVAIFAYIARAFGNSSKQEHYKDVLIDFKTKKREDLQHKLEETQDLSAQETMNNIESLESKRKEIDLQLLKDLELRKSKGRFPAPKANEALHELEKLGF